MAPKSLAPASRAAAAADTMEVDYGSDGSFELMDETFGEEITKEDYQMAEHVAEALAGTPVEGDLQKITGRSHGWDVSFAN